VLNGRFVIASTARVRRCAANWNLYLCIAFVLMLSILAWQLNPYACCPRVVPSSLPVTVRVSEPCGAARPGQVSQTRSDHSSPSQEMTTTNPLAEGSLRNISFSTPSLACAVASEHYAGLLVVTLLGTGERPSSAIVPPPKYPPRSPTL
jgi:hypothetical protein